MAQEQKSLAQSVIADNNMLKECRAMNLLGETSPDVRFAVSGSPCSQLKSNIT